MQVEGDAFCEECAEGLSCDAGEVYGYVKSLAQRRRGAEFGEMAREGGADGAVAIGDFSDEVRLAICL